MLPLSRSLRHLTLRRSLRARPIQVIPSSLPLRFARPVTIYAPGPSSSSDSNDPARYEIIPPSASPDPSSSSSSGSSDPSTPPPGSSRHPSESPITATANDQPPPPPPDPDSPTSPSPGLVVSNLPQPPETVPVKTPPHLQHPFDTHAFVSYLEKNGLSSGSAETLMQAVRKIIVRRSEQTRDDMLGKEDMENAAYLFRAALSELRTELSVKSRNDGVALKAMTAAIQREVDSLEQKLKEDVQTLKHDIEMDMGNRKSETRTEMKGFDIAIEEINNKFTISLGDLRTEIESAKWDATRRAISIIVLLVVAGVAVTIYTAPAPVVEKSAVKPPPPATRDMAVGMDDELLPDDGDEVFPEERIEKLLSDRVAEKVRSPRKGKEKKEELFVDKI
ncbi:hypothetical protein JCM24511_07038 [Saitozyma sp. JCM 24511]|nr:hypothetical protein JCM24511_07038 [Saitozyma sp. JCM 24511]